MQLVRDYHLREAWRELEHLHALTDEYVKRAASILKGKPRLRDEAMKAAGRLGKELDLLEEALRILERLTGEHA